MDNYIIYPKQFRSAKIPVERNRCFMLMSFEKEFDLIYGVIKNELQENGFICNRADEISGSKPIMNKILTEILKSQYIIADLTNLNPNVFYELGIAHTFKDAQNILILKQKGSKCPFDISHLTYIEYDKKNLKFLTSTILNFIEENKYVAGFQEALYLKNIINIIHDNKEEFVDYLQMSLEKELPLITDILNFEIKDVKAKELNELFTHFNTIIDTLIKENNFVLLSGVLKVYFELIASSPCQSITDQLVIDFMDVLFYKYNLSEKDVLSWQTDMALLLASRQQKMNIIMPWIINYFSRTKSTSIDLNRYKLERFLMLSSDEKIDQIISDAIFDKNCYVREHMADIIGEKKLKAASLNLLKRLEMEDNYYTAVSIIEAIGKIKANDGLKCIKTWVSENENEIIKTKQFFVLKHARIALSKLDSSPNLNEVKLFDQRYGKYLENYFIL